MAGAQEHRLHQVAKEAEGPHWRTSQAEEGEEVAVRHQQRVRRAPRIVQAALMQAMPPQKAVRHEIAVL